MVKITISTPDGPATGENVRFFAKTREELDIFCGFHDAVIIRAAKKHFGTLVVNQMSSAVAIRASDVPDIELVGNWGDPSLRFCHMLAFKTPQSVQPSVEEQQYVWGNRQPSEAKAYHTFMLIFPRKDTPRQVRAVVCQAKEKKKETDDGSVYIAILTGCRMVVCWKAELDSSLC